MTLDCLRAGQRRESFEVKRQQLNTMGSYYGGALGNMAPSPAGPGGLLQAGQSMTPPPSLSGSSSNLSISKPHPLFFLLLFFVCLLALMYHCILSVTILKVLLSQGFETGTERESTREWFS